MATNGAGVAKPDRPLGLSIFGVAVGTFTTLSTQVGATTGLIGLLFTIIGGTFLAWFKDDIKNAEVRQTLARYAGFLGGGVLAGLFVGIGLRFLDATVLQGLAYGKGPEECIRVADLKAALGENEAAGVLAKLMVKGKLVPIGSSDVAGGTRRESLVKLQRASVEALDELASDLGRLQLTAHEKNVTRLVEARRAEETLVREVVPALQELRKSDSKLDDLARRHLDEVLKSEGMPESKD